MKRNTKVKLAFTGVSLALVTSIIGSYAWSLNKKSNEVESYIDSDYSFKGTLVKKDIDMDNIDQQDLDFLILEVPNFREALYENAIYIDNIEQCQKQDMPCALYQRTCAKNETEIDVEVALLNSFLEKNTNCYDVYIDIMDVADNLSQSKIIEYIRYFKRELYYKDVRTVFSMTQEVYNKIEGYLTDDVEILLQTENKDFENKTLDSYMISRDIWDRNYDLARYESDKPLTIYKNCNYLGISESGRETIGVDISEHQGQIDFGTLKNNVGYAIVRWADYYTYSNGRCIDSKFDTNILGCEENDIKYGVYVFSRATNRLEGENEAEALCNDLLAKKIDPQLPVFIDMESNNNNTFRELLSQKDYGLVDALDGFCSKAREMGFVPGIYMCEAEMLELKQIATENNSSLFEDNILWVANWGDNEKVTHDSINNYSVAEIDDSLEGNVYIQQITENGVIPGIDGYVDYNKTLKKLL